MQREEDKWGVMIKVVEEWEKTFETLLEYYNTKDLRSIFKSICRSQENLTKNKFISLKELEKWMEPQIEPSLWIKILAKLPSRWGKEFEEAKNKCKKSHDDLLGSDATLFQKSVKGRQLQKKTSTEKKEKLSKIDFVRSIVRQLRNGDKEVS